MLDNTVKHLRCLRQGTFLSSIRKRSQLKKFIYQRNLFNITRYGWSAPRCSERIWVQPHKCNKSLLLNNLMDITGGFNSNQDTWAMVIESAWPEKLAISITDVPRIKYCIDHWVKDIPWENCGAHEFQLKSRGRSQELIVKKFEHLDKVFEQVKM